MPSPLISLLIAALGLVAVQVAGRRTPLLTAITLATLLSLPLFAFLPKIHLQLPTTAPIAIEASASAYVKIYLLGLVVFGAKFILDLFAFSRWKKASHPLTNSSLLEEILATSHQQLGMSRKAEVRMHPKLASPVAGGLL